METRIARRGVAVVGMVVFLLEERSMKEFLDSLLPRLFPGLNPNQHFLCIEHEGKNDLESSIPRTLKAWREPGTKFVIVRDNDSDDCFALKERLRNLCRGTIYADSLIRIVCQELEAWYLGEPDALADVYSSSKLRRIGRQAKFRDPDVIEKPSRVIEQRCPSFQKVIGARQMAERLTPERNRSHSFWVFVGGLTKLFAMQFPELGVEGSGSVR